MLAPRRDYVLILPESDPTELKTKGGLVVPNLNNALSPHAVGLVLAVGPGHMRDDGNYTPLDLVENTRVLYPRHGGFKHSIEGIEHVLIREQEIIALA